LEVEKLNNYIDVLVTLYLEGKQFNKPMGAYLITGFIRSVSETTVDFFIEKTGQVQVIPNDWILSLKVEEVVG
jgi:hypothetical protein